MTPPRVDVSVCPSPYSRAHRVGRALWGVVWTLAFRPSPAPLGAWRRALLRLFGARIGRDARIAPSARVFAPWNLEMGDFSCLGPHVDCYAADRVTVGAHATVSQYAYLCGASHDPSDPHMRLFTRPISIGEGAWVCADAYVAPGVTVGEGAVVGARASVFKDVEPWTIVGGNPARVLRRRELRAPPGEGCGPVDAPAAAPATRRGPARRAASAAALLLLLVAALEAVLRLAVGLGDPPLFVADAATGYRGAPSSTFHRLGRRISYDGLSLRSDDFPARRSSAAHVRVLVLGDSVAHGGVALDQAEVATSLLGPRLAARLGRPVAVGNASAPGWGPPSQLAWLRTHGAREADVVALLASGHDLADEVALGARVGLDPELPDRAPPLALQDLGDELLRACGWRTRPAGPPVPPGVDHRCRAAIVDLLRLARASGARALLVHHREQGEPEGRRVWGSDRLPAIAEEAGATYVDLGPSYAAATAAGAAVFIDHIHPSAAGQRVIARVLEDAVVAALERTSTPDR